MSNLYFGPIYPDTIQIGDYAEYRYTGLPLGFITNVRYSHILGEILVKLSNYPYEINPVDLCSYRLRKNG